MRQKLLLLVVLCLVCLTLSAKAQTVIEAESKISFNENSANVSLAIENSGKPFNDKIELELLDGENKVRAIAAQNALVENGRKSYDLTLPLGDLMKQSELELAWFRLRYRVGDRASGVVSISQIIPDVFELRVIAFDALLSGMNYRARVRAFNPLTNKPVSGVAVSGDLSVDLKEDSNEEKLKLSVTGETDAEGFAMLDFQIPVEENFDDEGDAGIKVTGRKNGLVREAQEDLQTPWDDHTFLMLIDKPIYQPDQTVSVRGILMKGREGKTIVAGEDVEFRIEDEDETVLYREKARTSPFGVANMTWKIPENAKLGEYVIRVKTRKQEEGSYAGYYKIKISRYDLPNFAVKAKALKPYYLPNENQAQVEVSANYLFGKPVTRGHVRVVREEKREWNWEEQKYDIEEGESHEGEIDKDGKFSAAFGLTRDYEELNDNRWRKFDDLQLTAYFTDLTTNKTEQKRFDVRVTREPIHVYFISVGYNQNPKLPITGYVSSFYADGTPAACDVELKGREKDGDDKQYRIIQRLKTNSLGVGKLEFKRPKFKNEDASLEIQLIAKDKNGLQGTYGVGEKNEESIYLEADEEQLTLETGKTIFKPGEAIDVEIKSTVKTGLVYVDVVKNWSVIDSRFVNLSNGAATLKIPYQPNFKGELKIAAFSEDGDDDLIEISRGIIFPAQTNLKLETKFDRESYKPGEEAKVGFAVTDAVGKAVESALGVVVFDKAVEERARTDGDFKSMFSDFSEWFGSGASFGNFNVKDLNELDLSKPIGSDLQLVAEVMLYDEYYTTKIFHSRSLAESAKSVYADFFKKQFEPLEKMLVKHYENRDLEHPTNDSSFQKILRENNFDFDSLRDPWEQKYRAVFETEKANDILRIETAGADKTFGTPDDFTVSSSSFEYFKPTGKAIDKAFENYHKRTGDFIRDEKTLFRELGITEMKDRFGNPYQFKFEIDRKYYQLRIRSFGKDGVNCGCSWNDDFEVWTNKIEYFAETESAISKILKTAKDFPLDEAEFRAVLRENGIDLNNLRDAYGEKFYIVAKRFLRYVDKPLTEKVQKDGETAPTERTTTESVTQQVQSFEIRGKGADKSEKTYDDVTFAEFAKIISEQSKTDEKPRFFVNKSTLLGKEEGSICGTIKDPNGAVIPGASITVTGIDVGFNLTVTSNDDGYYCVLQVPAGRYKVTFAATRGFAEQTVTNVQVQIYSLTTQDFDVMVGSSAVVDVQGGSAPVATSSNKKDKEERTNNQKSTPRLREYFPETLLWSPEIVTDENGKASLKFKMADNLTTWKFYALASDKQGKIGTAEKEITVFQPFFVDLDPPRILTNGDEIYLPVQVRNYTSARQKVNVTMAKSDWFSFLGANKQSIEIAKGAAGNAIFGFKALSAIKDGKQKVTALAAKDSDAIEKPVTVHPNGQEIVRAESKLFTGEESFDVDFPANALAGSQRAELKIYPNLMTQVAEAVEGLLKRPYGCGEQTISSTYPNLMILKFKAGASDSALQQKARKYLQKGYDRLLGYQVADGGFSYWGGKDSSDVALTAYALRFLADAKDFVAVDPKTIENAQNYLVKQQRADGSFTKKDYWETVEDTRRTKLFTSYVTRTLAMLKTDKMLLDKALAYLKTRNAEIDEPYTLALYGLASFDAGNKEEARAVAKRLAAMVKYENGTAYWNLETNTPFYGWGTAGRIETTALVVQLLWKIDWESGGISREMPYFEIYSKGLLFLFKNKDRYGVWHSTQTTINVLDAFLARASTNNEQQNVTISINGEKYKDFTVMPEQIEPLVLDLSDKLTSSANRVEIKTSGSSDVLAQVVGTHYIDWKDAEISNRNVNDSRAIRLDYKCDKQAARIMETVNCSVEAERIGFKGYGMLLAEIGIPPGADVSRESLEKAFGDDWSLSRYEILPDKIVVYMWAKAGGSKFNFSFKPRYGINAQTPASVIYDYYNEEAKATVQPLHFEVK